MTENPVNTLQATLQAEQHLQGTLYPRGEAGFSPEVTVSDIEGGHRITITDISGAKTVDVMDGEAGPQGDSGQPDVVYSRPENGVMLSNVEYRLGKISELSINRFQGGSSYKADIWSVQFYAGDAISVTVPSNVIWYAAQPVFTPGNTYMLTFLMMENYQYICVWVEVTP